MSFFTLSYFISAEKTFIMLGMSGFPLRDVKRSADLIVPADAVPALMVKAEMQRSVSTGLYPTLLPWLTASAPAFHS